MIRSHGYCFAGGDRHLNQLSRTGRIVLCLFLYTPVVWAALLIAQSLGDGGLPVLACTGAYIMGLLLYSANQGNTRQGEEHGSARWGDPKQVNAQFCQKKNKLLTRNVRLGLDTHKHRRSLNVLVTGGSGAAKTRGYVLPNIL